MAQFQIKDVSTVMSSTIVTGFVRDGDLKAGMRAKVNDRTLEIKTIEIGHMPAAIAKKGDIASIGVRLFSNVFGEGVALGKPNPEFELLMEMKGTKLEFS
jgi:GTPase